MIFLYTQQTQLEAYFRSAWTLSSSCPVNVIITQSIAHLMNMYILIHTADSTHAISISFPMNVSFLCTPLKRIKKKKNPKNTVPSKRSAELLGLARRYVFSRLVPANERVSDVMNSSVASVTWRCHSRLSWGNANQGVCSAGGFLPGANNTLTYTQSVRSMAEVVP